MSDWVRDNLLAHQAGGCVALKIPIAYDRGLDFDPVSDDLARQAFARLTAVLSQAAGAGRLEFREQAFRPMRPATLFSSRMESADPVDVKTFQDYLFFQICRMAADLNLPVQIHTGMGQGHKTNAIHLQPAIREFSRDSLCAASLQLPLDPGYIHAGKQIPECFSGSELAAVALHPVRHGHAARIDRARHSRPDLLGL